MTKLLETNPSVIKKIERERLGCSYCRPNKGENRGRNNQHYKTHKSWKYKGKSPRKTKQFNYKV